MANITERPDINVSATLEFNEVELRALDALVGYGFDPFIKVFYTKLGQAYMAPHEAGLRSIFKSVSCVVPGILRRVTDARRVFTGERLATHHPKFPLSGVHGEDQGLATAWRKP